MTMSGSRSELAKLIYLMSKDQQERFRLRFPTPIHDEQVDAARDYAERMHPVAL